MPKRPPRALADDLRAASRLITDATTGTTEVVEQMHQAISRGPGDIFRPFTGPVEHLASLVYASVRGVTRAVGLALDEALAELAPLLGDSTPGPERRAAVAALNGVMGDQLAGAGNPLAQVMELSRHGGPLELDQKLPPAAVAPVSTRLVVLVHGSSMNELQWNRLGHDHGAALERELGFSAVYLCYNSGLHISTNGRQLAAELERLVRAWPADVDELVLVGHSMGGLVARSACHAAELAGLPWRSRLRALVCLGAPHHGAPLEQRGNWAGALLGATRYSAPIARLAKIRSAGVTDLRFGYVLDEHWAGRDRFAPGLDGRAPLPLPRGVRCFAVAATRSMAPGGRLLGDGLVTVASALGQSDDPRLRLDFPSEHQQLTYRAGHLDLLSRPEVFASLKGWLAR